MLKIMIPGILTFPRYVRKYTIEAMPYESSLIGYFTVWQGPENDACDRLNIQKRNEVR